MVELLQEALGADWMAVLEGLLLAGGTNALASLYRRIAPGKWEQHARFWRYGLIGLSAAGTAVGVAVLGGSPLTWAVLGPMALKAFVGGLGLRQLVKHAAPSEPASVIAIGRGASIETKLPPRSLRKGMADLDELPSRPPAPPAPPSPRR